MSLQVLELVWKRIKDEAKLLGNNERICSDFLYKILFRHKNLSDVLSYILSYKLANVILPFDEIYVIIHESYKNNPDMILCAVRDICAFLSRDPVVDKYCIPVLYFKGFHALQAYRVSHWLWTQNRKLLALYFQSQISFVFNVDIHPAAFIGSGVVFDHATGIIIGETSVIEDNVSILQFVTLGSRGDEVIGDRHPKIRSGVMLGAGSIVLGNIEIGCFAKVGAGSVVLRSVPAYVTVAGNPAKVVDGCVKKKLDIKL